MDVLAVPFLCATICALVLDHARDGVGNAALAADGHRAPPVSYEMEYEFARQGSTYAKGDRFS